MNGVVFVDTGAFYAIQVPNDRWHLQAVATLKALLAKGTPLISSNHVVGETYTLLLKTHGHRAATLFLGVLDETSRLERVHLEAEVEAEAWKLLYRFSDQAFSFVDGSSFALMKHRRIKHAFAFDRHFAAAGFVRVGVDAPA